MSENEIIMESTNGEAILPFLYEYAIRSRFPLAIWRFPHDDKPQAIIALTQQLQRPAVRFNNLPGGFVVTPFFNHAENSPYFIEADVLLRDGRCYVNRTPHADKRRNHLSLLRACESNHERRLLPHSWYAAPSASGEQPMAKRAYCDLVEHAVATIRSGKLRKVVLSRAFDVDLTEDFAPLLLFQKLCAVYPSAFVSLVALPGVGTWIGATPELLLSLKHDELTTVALAGTRSIGEDDSQWPPQWGEKEIVEQEIVSEFIRDAFAQQSIEDYTEQNTESVRIGNLLHLQTIFNLKHLSQRRSDVVEQLLWSLHPTPAVCGVPKQRALSFIREHELHKRHFYAGYLGPVNLNQQSHLFVNLRCMQLMSRSARLYAGGGITIDSIAEQEWLETEMKLDALLKVLYDEAPAPQSLTHSRGTILCYD